MQEEEKLGLACVSVPLVTLPNSAEYKHHQNSLNQSSRNVKLLGCMTL